MISKKKNKLRMKMIYLRLETSLLKRNRVCITEYKKDNWLKKNRTEKPIYFKKK